MPKRELLGRIWSRRSEIGNAGPNWEAMHPDLEMKGRIGKYKEGVWFVFVRRKSS